MSERGKWLNTLNAKNGEVRVYHNHALVLTTYNPLLVSGYTPQHGDIQSHHSLPKLMSNQKVWNTMEQESNRSLSQKVSLFGDILVKQEKIKSLKQEEEKRYSEPIEQEKRYTEPIEQEKRCPLLMEQEKRCTKPIEQEKRYTEPIEQEKRYTVPIEQEMRYTEPIEQEKRYIEPIEQEKICP
ncbi:variable charge X-linked protein 3B-like [Eurytemora carolleeae]|uniref:variable charge X-linked protein 3B-like n=1 Tax=Eurytemora carolleeae TaxID=1294199 RepID=UPI000C77AFD2|nr:variable charge X-linked protein 3B-like [Eurytemora carolleeae]|eukprot:XP_023320709.1 variable charge X-linked protein 3B-like [Eurytemora affinis]